MRTRPEQPEDVIVVTGLPRSGTSLMMRLLEAGGIPLLVDHQRAADLDNPMGYFELEAVKTTARDPSWLTAAPGRAVKVIHALLEDLPSGHRYRILCMRRHLDEVVRSQRAMRQRSGEADLPLKDAELATILLWQLNDAIAWARRQPNMSLLEVHYNALLADPLPHLHRINGFLGGQLDLEAMRAVVDPTLYRNRR